MDTHCLKCGMQVPSLGRFCPFCGTVVAHESLATAHESLATAHESLATAHEYHRAPGAFGGFFYGLIAAPILIIPGVLLCLLGWGLILGLPMILLGIMLPIAGPLFGMGEHKGKCPSCGTRIISVEDGKKHACPVCNATFAMEDQHMVGLEHREGELQVK